jgi:hypothetical protein
VIRRLLASEALHRHGPFLLLAVVLGYYAGYVKDDAYISFRYAANWARGAGLVFNPGERVEGYTNFLWVAASAGVIRLGIPPLLGMKLLSALLALLGLHWTRRLTARFVSEAASSAPAPTAADRAAWLYAASPTLGLWSASGLEGGACAALAALAALAAARAAETRTWGAAALAGIVLAACALLRPEGHLLLALTLVAPRAAPFALALLVPYHWLRVRYFGELLPNTFLIKAGGESTLARLTYVGLFLAFYGHAILLGLGAWWTARARARLARVALGIVLAFVLYLGYVGGDEMRWFRLYAPALPLLLALAAARLPNLLLLGFVLAGLVTHGAGFPLRDYVAQGDRSYRLLGEAIAARARPGDRALFQDGGRTPFTALAVPFDDPIGLTDRALARLYRAARWSPFRGLGPAPLEAAIRDELLSRNPRFLAFVAYVERRDRALVRERFAIDPEGTLRPYLRDVSYAHGIPADARFRRYRFAGAWRRNDGYYLALYERRD